MAMEQIWLYKTCGAAARGFGVAGRYRTRDRSRAGGGKNRFCEAAFITQILIGITSTLILKGM